MALTPPTITPFIHNPGSSNPIKDFNLTSLTQMILLIAGIIAVLYTMYNGYRYMIAGGDTKKVAEARNGLISAIIGVVIIMSTYFIINLSVSLGWVAANCASRPNDPRCRNNNSAPVTPSPTSPKVDVPTESDAPAVDVPTESDAPAVDVPTEPLQ